MNAFSKSLFVVFLLAACPAARAATISASSCEADDVQAALNLAKAGDTVLIPAGSAGWSKRVTWTAPPNVTVKGAGTSATGGGDQTVIQDDYAANQRLLDIKVSSSGVFRLTGITFRSGSGTIKDGGTINIQGPGTVRIDHCHFIASSGANYKMVRFGAGLFGVLDQCILDFDNLNALYFYNGRQGEGDWMGNYEWSLPTDFGGPDYFYIEDNIINGDASGSSYSTRIFDGFTAAKVVVRFNDVSQAVLGETHATGHSPDDRGLRSQEIYGNKVTSSLAKGPNFTALDMGSGTTLVWGNSWDQVYKHLYLFKVTRSDNTTYSQAATPNGWGYCGTEFDGRGSYWDGGTALGTNPFSGYPCLDQPGRGQGDLITGGLPNKVNSVTGTIYWPNQALEPVYIWNNIGDVAPGWGGSPFSNRTRGRVAANRDYYPAASGQQTSPTTPFDGTAGTGWGTLANRPTTCTPGVAYFATDQGSWNSTASNPYGVQQNGADGVLYKCTAPNTWTLYYVPFDYPHPLRMGPDPGPEPEQPPDVTDQPQSLNLTEGESATFAVVAGGTAPLQYQWQKDGVDIVGATSPNLVISSVTASNAGTYRCAISNSFGVVFSADANLSVAPPSPPVIVESPQDYTRTVGQSVTFTVTAFGSSPLAYQWQRKVEINNSEQTSSIYWSDLSGETSSTFSLPSVTLADNKEYRCEVSNGLGSAVSSVAVLKVNPEGIVDLTSGLLAYFPLDEAIGLTAFDATRKGNDGNLQGAVWTESGARFRGLSFDGIDDFVALPNLDILGDGLSISLWFNPDDLLGSSIYRDGRLLSKAAGRNGEDHYWMVSTVVVESDTRLRFRLKAGGTTSTLIASSGNIQEGEWTHVVAVYDGNQMLLYQDQQLVGSMDKTGMVDLNAAVPVNIGRNPDGYGEWNGVIDEVAIYNRALSPSEVQALHQTPSPTERPSAPTWGETNLSGR